MSRRSLILFIAIVFFSCSRSENSLQQSGVPSVIFKTESVMSSARPTCKTSGYRVKIFASELGQEIKYIKTIDVCKESKSINGIATVGEQNRNYTIRFAGVLPNVEVGGKVCEHGGTEIALSTSLNIIKNNDAVSKELLCYDNALAREAVGTASTDINIFSNGDAAGIRSFTIFNEGSSDALIKSITSTNEDFKIVYDECRRVIFSKHNFCDIGVSYTPKDSSSHGNMVIEFLNALTLNISLTGEKAASYLVNATEENIEKSALIFASDSAQPAHKDITIRNSSSNPIAIKGIRYGSYHFFTDTNLCGDTIPANSECDIGVGYIPLNDGDSSVNAKI